MEMLLWPQSMGNWPVKSSIPKTDCYWVHTLIFHRSPSILIRWISFIVEGVVLHAIHHLRGRLWSPWETNAHFERAVSAYFAPTFAIKGLRYWVIMTAALLRWTRQPKHKGWKSSRPIFSNASLPSAVAPRVLQQLCTMRRNLSAHHDDATRKSAAHWAVLDRWMFLRSRRCWFRSTQAIWLRA